MPSGQNGDNRLDRIEHALELLIDDHVQFQEGHKKLLTAQVLLTDRMDTLTKTVADHSNDTGRRIAEFVEAGKHTDERLNALITIADGMIRNRPTT